MSRKLLLAAMLGAVTLIPVYSVPTVYAQSTDKEKAMVVFERGNTQYNLGKWAKAIALFEEAYTLHPYPAFLFNIAHSHRQSGDCKQASFFYKRYLTEKANPSNRKRVEDLIREVEDECRRKVPVTPAVTPDTGKPNTGTPDLGKPNTGTPDLGKPNTGTPDPGKPNTGTPSTGTPSNGTPDAAPAKPSLLVAHVYGGPSLVLLDEDVSAEFGSIAVFNMTLNVGYPIHVGDFMIDVGGLFAYQPLPWQGPEDSGTMGMMAFLGNVGASTEVISNLRIRGELGLGAMVVSGLDDDANIFLEDEEFPGLTANFAFRVAIGAEYAVTENVAIAVQPLVYQSAPNRDKIVIDSFESVQALFGLRVSM